MYGNANQLLTPILTRVTAEFPISMNSLVLCWYPFNADYNKLVLLARLREDYPKLLSELEKREINDEVKSKRARNGVQTTEILEFPYWLGVGVLIPGYNHKEKKGFPPLLNFSVSFYQKIGASSCVINTHALTLASAFFAQNRAWFERNGFQDLVFGGTGPEEKDCVRPTRY